MRIPWAPVPGVDRGGLLFRLTLVRRSNMYNAVGRLLNGVYTVAGPFHPFGGAVDTIVVQQQDGSYKSSPWYVKFGKFQGVLKRSEKVVNIAVNDEPLNFHMFLDSTGEAYFLKDAEPDKEPFPSSSQLTVTSGDEVLALEEEASKVEDGLEKQPLLSEPAIISSVEVLALESSSEPPGEEIVALESSSKLAITSGDEVIQLESSLPLSITSSDEVFALEDEASKSEDGLEIDPSLSQLAITFGAEVLALVDHPCKAEDGSQKDPSSSALAITSGDEALALADHPSKVEDEPQEEPSSSELAITSVDEALASVDHPSKVEAESENEPPSSELAITSGDEVLASVDHPSKVEDESAKEPSSSELAITSGDEALALADHPSKVEDEPQEEPSSSELAITSGDEVLELVDHPSKVENELESKVSKEDVEKGESSDENDSNLALRFEGRKASYLLVQQAAEAQAAEAHAAEEARIAKARNEEARIAEAKDEAKLAESSSLKENKVRSFLPTSQMLASMNLKEGSNRITFTFFTRVLGKQQVDARIYLWKWNTRVVISDVDGTITKSDVLGQVMPLMGRDWTQLGVTRLFSAIKENGYEIMFLSARAISQAYLTRQFLVNLKQDGETLPDGPVVISPDGLFPSLYREVIRRAPHEFKIACLQDIRDLFPEDCNPFYAGFGNRDTDEISYLKVGIPKGKIFIINPKGEVAVNKRVDVKSYTSLHKLVDDMFPPQTYTEQEDFNSWNYWKIPLPDIEDELSVKSGSKPRKTKR